MQKVTQFKSNSGAVFDTEMEAHRDDLLKWLCEAAGNDPIARQIARAMERDAAAVMTMLAGIATPTDEPQIPGLEFQRFGRGLRGGLFIANGDCVSRGDEVRLS